MIVGASTGFQCLLTSSRISPVCTDSDRHHHQTSDTELTDARCLNGRKPLLPGCKTCWEAFTVICPGAHVPRNMWSGWNNRCVHIAFLHLPSSALTPCFKISQTNVHFLVLYLLSYFSWSFCFQFNYMSLIILTAVMSLPYKWKTSFRRMSGSNYWKCSKRYKSNVTITRSLQNVTDSQDAVSLFKHCSVTLVIYLTTQFHVLDSFYFENPGHFRLHSKHVPLITSLFIGIITMIIYYIIDWGSRQALFDYILDSQ